MFSICFPYLPILFQVDFYPLRPSLCLDVVPLQPGGDVVRIPTARAVEEGRQLVPAEPGQLGPVGREFLGEKWRKMVDLSDFTIEKWWKSLISHDFHHGKLMDQPNIIQVSCISWISLFKGWMSGNISTGNHCFYRSKSKGFPVSIFLSRNSVI